MDKNGVIIGTEFDFWREKWQQEIDERQRKNTLLKGITFDTLVLLSLHVEWVGKGKKDFKCAVSVESVNDTQLIGKPIAVEVDVYMSVYMRVYKWDTITDIKILQKKDLPLLLGYKRLFPLYDKLLKGE